MEHDRRAGQAPEVQNCMENGPFYHLEIGVMILYNTIHVYICHVLHVFYDRYTRDTMDDSVSVTNSFYSERTGLSTVAHS